jgi:hypothetical protein
VLSEVATSRSIEHVNLYPYRRGLAFQSLFRGIFGVLLSFTGWAKSPKFAAYWQSNDPARGVFGSIGINCTAHFEMGHFAFNEPRSLMKPED